MIGELIRFAGHSFRRRRFSDKGRTLFAVALPAKILLALACIGAAVGQPLKPVSVRQETLTLPTYEEGLPDPNPPFEFFGVTRLNYPYTLRNRLTDRSAPHAWRSLVLENEYLKCTVLPDLGGHLYSCTDKVNGREMFYANPSIKYAAIAYRGTWAAFGIEFNFPVSHNWMTTSPVDFASSTEPDGAASIWVGNIDRVYGMQWLVQLRLRAGRSILEQQTLLCNRSDTRHRFYWWTNAAVEAWDDTQILYPMTFTASHGFADVDTWPVNSAGVDLSIVGNHKRGSVSRFSHGSREAYMAAYHPRTRAGLVHFSSPTDLPSKKIWSWGSNPDGLDWRKALSDNDSAYIEIQAGLFRNQETYGFLEPQESIRFSEYWQPIRELGGLSRANTDAALHIQRGAAPTGRGQLEVRLNVTRSFADARLELADGDKVLASDVVSIAPAKPAVTIRRYPNIPMDRRYTVTLRDSAGAVILQHTEGLYDLLPKEQVTLGRRPPDTAVPAAERGDGDFALAGMQQELDGKRLLALSTYEEGLSRYPSSIELLRSAGRLAVELKQYAPAAQRLRRVMARISNDRESAYYLGEAELRQGNRQEALRAFEIAQSFGAHRPAALFKLAAIASQSGDLVQALQRIRALLAERKDALRAGGMEVALLRRQGMQDEARQRLRFWRRVDPTNSLLRHESNLLGNFDQSLLEHLAADPERILEAAVDYMQFGLYDDALLLLSQTYPVGSGVISEPGMPRPEAYPLIAYYRAYCKKALGRDDHEDLATASALPTLYVFPNRPESLRVLEEATRQVPSDATAHFLLGSAYLSGGMKDLALAEWEKARALNPKIPVLHRNMAYTLLNAKDSLGRAIEIFREGTKHDSDNVGLYYGLDLALSRAGRPAAERAEALLSFPDQSAMPAGLVYKLAFALAESGRYDQAERLFFGRFFPREEGGINVRQIYMEVRLRRALALASAGRCREARAIAQQLTAPVEGLRFTQDGMEAFLRVPQFQEWIRTIHGACPADAPSESVSKR